MKRHIINIIPAFFILVIAASCYKDLSTPASISIPEIEIINDLEVINVAYGHYITMEAQVQEEGRTEDDFSYLWEIDLVHGSVKDRLEIGTEKTLSYQVGNSPSDKPYTLTLKVTDKVNGLEKMESWPVYVSSSLGEGIIVAHKCNEDGTAYDVDLLAAKPITFGYQSDAPLVTRNLYQFANGRPIDGRINSMITSVVTDGAVFNTTRIMIGTDTDLIALNPIDYKEVERNASLFNSKESFFGTSYLFNFADYLTCAFIDGRFFSCICNFDRAYTKVPLPSGKDDIFTKSNVAFSKPDQGRVLVFSPFDNKFYYATCLSIQGGMSAIESSSLPYSLTGANAVGGGCLKNMFLGMILKLADASYHLVMAELYSLNPTLTDYPLDGIANIDKAVDFAFCDNANLFYYCTSDKIYSVTLSGNQVTGRTLSWKPDSEDEKITHIEQYAQNWYGTSQNSFNNYPFVLDYHRLQLVIVTYNEKTKEGKIYLRPFSTSTGLFTLTDNGRYEGFGEISAIATTPR